MNLPQGTKYLPFMKSLIGHLNHANFKCPMGEIMHFYLWWPVERVCIQDGLYHYQRLGQILPHKLVSIIGAFIRTVVEHLQKWRPPQMEHKLPKTKSRSHFRFAVKFSAVIEC